MAKAKIENAATDYRKMAAFFEALSDPARLQIVDFLRAGEQSVGEVGVALGISQPMASRHLARLESSGILERRRAGALVYYSIANAAVLRLCDSVCGRV